MYWIRTRHIDLANRLLQFDTPKQNNPYNPNADRLKVNN